MATAAKRKTRADGDAEPDKAELLHYYRDMLLIRRFEEKAGQLYGMGLIGGFCHLYIGQEAVVVGMQTALTPGTASSQAIATTVTCWPAAWMPRA
jgi:pyruvate dehydrogenase E1 component subunit alpha